MALCSPSSSVMVTAYLRRPGVSTIEAPCSHRGESSPPRWLASVPSLPAIELPSSSSSQGGRERILLSEQPSFWLVSIEATTRSHQRGDSFPLRQPVSSSSSSSAYLRRPGHSSIEAIRTRRGESFPLRRFVSVPSSSSSHAYLCLPGRSSIEKTRTHQGESFPPRQLVSVFSSAMDSSSSSSAYLRRRGHPPIEAARTHRDGSFPLRRPVSVSSSAMDSPSSQGGREQTLSEKPSFWLLRPFPELSGTPPLDSLASDPADPVHNYDDYEDDGDCGGIGLDPEIRTVLDNVAWLRKRNEEMSARMQEMERLLVDTVKFVNSKGRMIRSKDLKLEKSAVEIKMGNVMEIEKEAEKKMENGMKMGIKNETEKEKVDKTENEMEKEIKNKTENEMEKEIKNKTEKEIENKTENKTENETEKKIENKTENKTEKEMENNKTENRTKKEAEKEMENNKIGNKTEKETENKIESITEKEMKNKTENIRENKTENRRENKAEKETENKTENKTENNKTDHLQQNKLPPKQAFPTITANNRTLSQRKGIPKESITNGRNTNHSLPLANNRNLISKGVESDFGKTTDSLSFNPPTREAPMGESINEKATNSETLECTMVHPGALSCTKTSIQTDPSKKFVVVSIETTVRCAGDACSLTALKEEDYIALAVRTLAQTSLQLKKTKLEMVRNRDHGGTSIPHKNIVDILAHGKIVASRPMEPPSSFGHESFIVELKDLATGKKINALFKPRLQSDDQGWHRVPMELVAYELNLMLGMDLVPPVAYRRGGFHVHFKHYEDGAFIYYVPCARPLKVIPATNWGVPVVCLLSDTRILDALLNNSDRHLGHFLFGEHWTGKKEMPFLIDHAASFRKEAVVKMDHDNAFQTGPLRSVSAKTYMRLRFLEKQMLAQKFQEFLSDKEIDQLMERRDMTLEYLDKLAHDKGYSKTVVEA